jgi:hypothetical protein
MSYHILTKMYGIIYVSAYYINVGAGLLQVNVGHYFPLSVEQLCFAPMLLV